MTHPALQPGNAGSQTPYFLSPPTSAASRVTSHRLCGVHSTHKPPLDRIVSPEPAATLPVASALAAKPRPWLGQSRLNPASGGRASSGGSDREQAEMSPPPQGEAEDREWSQLQTLHGAPRPPGVASEQSSGVRSPTAGRDPLPGVWGSTFDLPLGTSSETRVPALTSQGWKLRVVTPTSGISGDQTG